MGASTGLRVSILTELTFGDMSHIVHIMKTVTIRELHLHTGKWVREASTAHEPLVVLDRGRPTARLVPFEENKRRPFRDRKKVRGFEGLPQIAADSGKMLEEERR